MSSISMAQEKREAREAIENFGTIYLSYDRGISCEDELRIIGVDIDLVKQCLKMIDYYACCIKYSGEYHKTTDLDEQVYELESELNRFKINGKKLDYELG